MKDDAEIHILEWRGKQTEPMALSAIREALEAGDIHSMYKIHDRGRWRVLRDFLEEQNARPAPQPPATPPAPAPAPAPQPAPPQMAPQHGQAAHYPQAAASGYLPPGPGHGMAPAPQAAAAAPASQIWMVALVLVIVLIPFCVIGGYLLFRPQAEAVAASQPTEEKPAEAKAPETKPSEVKSTEVKQAEAKPGKPKSAKPKAPAAQEPKKRLADGLTVEELAEQKSDSVVRVFVSWEEPAENRKWREGGSTGSGVHISNKGGKAIFVTNRHVLQPPKGFRNLSVTMIFKGEEVSCELVGLARYGLDLAKIQVKHPDAKDGEVLQMIKTEEIKVGQRCVAIGNALGEGISVTDGIVSRFDESDGYRMIRTSAPISPGNSGGGLFRLNDGALIGITTSSVDGNGSQNINFAIPVDYIFSDLFWLAIGK